MIANILNRIAELLYPPKCLFCQKTLTRGQIDLCPNCRAAAPEFTKSKIKYSFIARWTSLWYYKDMARRSILRYKFYNRRSYAKSFGRLLAMKLQKEGMDDFDLLTWVPVSPLRRFRRGYDQVELLARAVARELNIKPKRLLQKIRHTPPQSGIREYAQRKANILGAYRTVHQELVRGKRILLLDDVLTSGATASECAKTLSISGAQQIYFAAIAASEHTKN